MVILFGASGHGKVIIDILELNGEKDITVWDDAAKAPLCGYTVSLPDVNSINDATTAIIAIGDNANRKKVTGRLPVNTTYLTAIHPTAIVSKSVSIAGGTAVMAGTVINTDTTIGKHCIINTSASLDHDCIIEDYVHISPNVTLCGNVSVGEGTHVGAGTVVIPGKKIGKWCVIGAGSVIIADVPDNTTVVGNPGRIIRQSTNG